MQGIKMGCQWSQNLGISITPKKSGQDVIRVQLGLLAQYDFKWKSVESGINTKKETKNTIPQKSSHLLFFHINVSQFYTI